MILIVTFIIMIIIIAKTIQNITSFLLPAYKYYTI